MRYKTLREIIYINTDDFYASVARIKDPSVKTRPLIVGYLSSRGVVVGASYEARKMGVRPGITIAQAKRLCPGAAFAQIDWEFVRKVSRAIFAAASRYSPVVEPVDHDEGFVDYTGCACLFGCAGDLARRFQRELADTLSLNVSLGIGPNKLVSRIASKAAKRAGLVDVRAGNEREFLTEFPVAWLPGMEGGRGKIFAAMGVKNIGTLAGIPMPLLERILGSFGRTLAERARGIDNRPVLTGRNETGGRGFDAGVIFAEDVICARHLDANLYMLSEKVAAKLRRFEQGAASIRLRLTYTDGYVAVRTARMHRVSALDGNLYGQAKELLAKAFVRRVKIRALDLEVAHTEPCVEQPDLFMPGRGRMDSLYRACDQVRRKYGNGRTLSFGKTFGLYAGPDAAGGGYGTHLIGADRLYYRRA